MKEAKTELMELASRLVSEDGENPEYDRGVCELIADYIGLPLNDGGALLVARKIGCKNTDKWYATKGFYECADGDTICINEKVVQ